MQRDIVSAHTREPDATAAAAALAATLEAADPRIIVFFASQRIDGETLSRALHARFPLAAVIGCTTAGEFTAKDNSTGGVAALAVSARKVRRAAAALARFEGGVAEGVRAATDRLASELDVNLRTADPSRYAGVVLVEGLRMHEEACNDALGNAAPLLSFVGGSAGDDLGFRQTRVFCNGEASDNGAALLLLDMAVPFVVRKTCSFAPVGRTFNVTRADEAERVVYEFDGRPVAEVYAEALGVAPEALGSEIFMVHPVGLVIDGVPWIRSPQRLLADGGLKFYCRIQQGMDVHLMRSTDLVGETRADFQQVREALGVPVSGGLVFNCILRRLELDARNEHTPFLEVFAGTEIAGFHTYGESWLAHINQTLTALWFG